MAAGAKEAKTSYTFSIKKSVLGAKVVNARREHLGKIEDVVIDSRNDTIAYAILSFGGFLGIDDKHFALPWQALDFDVAEKVAILNVEKERLENAPGFEKDKWPDMTDAVWAAEIHRHYGIRDRAS